MSLKSINNFEVVPISIPKLELKNIKGSKLFPEIYSNVYLCAKKKSGKTSVIFNIIRECADKNTNVIVFCSTQNKDKNWIEIKKYLNEKKIPNEFYNSMLENGNILTEIITDLQGQVSDEESSSEEEPELIKFQNKKRKPKKKKKPTIISPKYLIIFDDLSSELRKPEIAHLLKTNRHYKSKVVISSQYLNDLQPMSLRQIDYWLLFSGLPYEKLESVYKQADQSISFEQFYDLYKDATQERFSFFYIDTTNDTYRRNFNQEYQL